VAEARRLNHSYIGTKHLLLGLLREGDGIAFGVLESLGVSLDRVRRETVRVLSDPGRPESPPAGPPQFRLMGSSGVARLRRLADEELSIAPNSALRQAAVRMLEQARTALATIQHDELARGLIETLLTSQITTLIELLNLEASTRQELDDAMSRTMHALSTIVAATSVIQPYNPVAGEALSVANLAVLKAMSR
jgi:ATP-dependent Clp protease ATP-binding subunit ClpA